MTESALQRRSFPWQAALVVLLAWLLREQFIMFTHVVEPIRGDVRQYASYAWNLVHSGTFSMAYPGSARIMPDDFRGPGYPLFLAANFLVGGEDGGWYGLTLQLQAVLGAATVGLTMMLGRLWLSPRESLLAGVLMALWPHHIAASGAILSEVVFGFSLLLASWLAVLAFARDSNRMAIGAGLAYAFAYLVNPIVLLFPPLIALAMTRLGRKRLAVVLVAVPLLVAAAWGLRNAGLPEKPGEPGRLALNLVEGSWPEYHSAYNYKDVDATAVMILQDIHSEEQAMGRDPRGGLAMMADRMREAPGYYLTWYALRKPYLLWAWGIRIGWGDVYFVQVDHSPLDTNPALRAIKSTFRTLNPAFFLLAVAAAAANLSMAWRMPGTTDAAKFAAALAAAFFVYVTLLHTLLQAEPRYSIPYRPMEVLLAVTALAGLLRWARTRLATGASRERPETSAQGH